MTTNDIPTFDGTEEERGAQMRERLDAAGKDRVSELSQLYGCRVTYDGVPGTIDALHPEGRFRATLANGRQPWAAIDALQPDGDGFTYTTPEG